MPLTTSLAARIAALAAPAGLMGEEMEYAPGDFAIMAPGHDAWVTGDEPCVVID